jgi:hypothetical protein
VTDEQTPPDPAELQANLVRTLSSASATAALLPTQYFTQGHEHVSEMAAALRMTSVSAQLYLGLEATANATTEEARALGARMTRSALKQLYHDPHLRHLVHECPGEAHTPAGAEA